ncbi:MAG: nucleotidyl transferase AbiEii/AbiGii toxin family protein [Eggerthellaceae bacterium]|jgi:hypothetical protein|nr:nucleotidyl transferase AbiEii/AbiGii toxin family protein [Eggerthellaceae bacterium]MDR2716174.1 nucleotidyl transferase AbiEii/AbiGii toxin family protein [Coriobacteriaceae bacterium]
MEQIELAQREITKAALSFITDSDFALAGSGAIREHGLINRPTEDIDLFTTDMDPASFDRNVDLIIDGLASNGYRVMPRQRAERFARLIVGKDNLIVNIDLGVDWRENQPVVMDIGPVLNRKDAVASKASTLFSRTEARDFLDVDRIRTSGYYSDDELLDMIRCRDLGFDLDVFIQLLKYVDRLKPYQVNAYGVSAEQLDEVKARFNAWVETLRKL